MKSSNRVIVLQAFLVFLIVAQPLMSITKNPDILHDAYFFSQGKAMESGLKVHKDIYSPYGPLVPWIFFLNMKFAGDYLVIGRLLGFVIQMCTCLLMYIILRRKLSRLSSTLCVSLFVGLSPERTEVTSSRWIYGAGIWPTSVTILLTLIVMWIAIRVFENEKSDKRRFVKLFLASLVTPLLLVSRLQGILVFAVFILALLFSISMGERSVRRNALVVLIGIVLSGIQLFLQLNRNGVFFDTFSEMILGPFIATDATMEGRWLSWLTSLVISMVSSIICIFILTSFVKFLLEKYNVVVVTLGSVIVTFVFFMFASFFVFPAEFNGNLFLWVLKVITWIPSWIPWALSVSALYIIARVSLTWFKTFSVSPKEILIRSREDIFLIPMGAASFSHLFWNYSYIYVLLPITMIVVVFKREQFSLSLKSWTSMSVLAASQVFVFLLVSLTGFLQEYESYSSKIFSGMQDTRQLKSEIESVVDFISTARLEKASMYYCDYPIFRYYDVESYRVDKNSYVKRPKSRVAYLSSISNSANRILVCGENNFFNPSELNNSGWVESARKNIDENPSFSIQILSKLGGG